jgi:hypothetical protein
MLFRLRLYLLPIVPKTQAIPRLCNTEVLLLLVLQKFHNAIILSTLTIQDFPYAQHFLLLPKLKSLTGASCATGGLSCVVCYNN